MRWSSSPAAKSAGATAPAIEASVLAFENMKALTAISATHPQLSITNFLFTMLASCKKLPFDP
jgi:hypothetical protein